MGRDPPKQVRALEVLESTSGPAGGGASSILASGPRFSVACLDDNAIVALLERRLGEDDRARVEAHLDECETCRRLVAEMVRAQPHEGASGDRTRVDGGPLVDDDPDALRPTERGYGTFGRYVVLREIGRGGMGIVYAAYDPELDRKVALKVLRHEHLRRAGAQERMLREARAMARLTHPNVLPVYDVGTTDGRVFLAMEFVEGTTLRDWEREPGRTWKPILDAYLAAGQGLVAAHGLGIVHRDFKPANVLVGKDGRARVTDFGLATASSAHVQPESGRPRSDEAPASFPELTAEGAIVGTPAYMAPEQHLGEAADGKSDQFSFCVSLWEALYGERPFAGRTSEEILGAIVEGKIRSTPRGTRVPGHVRDALVRGLQLDPDRRHRSMRALLSALADDPRARLRHRVIGGSLVVAALVAGGVLVARARRSPAPPTTPCTGAEGRLAGIWDDARRTEIARAFASSGAEDATETLARVAATLDRWTKRWVAAETSSCTATRVEGSQSDAVFTLRNACLDRELSALKSLSDLLAKADADAVGHALDAAEGLPGVDACSAARVTASKLPPPDDAQAPLVEKWRRRLSAARTLKEMWKIQEALTLARDAVVEAKSIGYRPLEAEAELALGEVTPDDAAAEKALFDAVWAAEACRHDEVAAQGWIDLVRLATRLKHPDQVDDRAARASAAIERLEGDEALKAQLLDALAGARSYVGKYGEVLTLDEKLLDALSKTTGVETTQYVGALGRHVTALMVLGRLAEARRSAETLLPLAQKVDGVGGMYDLLTRTQLAAIDGRLGRDDAELSALVVVRDLAQKLEKKSAPEVDLFHAAVGAQETPDAAGQMKAWVQSTVNVLVAQRLQVTCARLETELRIDRGTASLAHAPLARALALVTKIRNDDFERVELLVASSRLARLEGRIADARSDASKAYDLAVASQPSSHPMIAGPLLEIAEADLLDKNPLDALDQLKKASRFDDLSPRGQGLIDFAIARARWDASTDRDEHAAAVELAKDARKTLASSEDVFAAVEAAQIDAWLQTHAVDPKP